MRIILPDPDRERHLWYADPDPANPDWYQFQAHAFFNTFFQKISICCQKISP
jgi:hypothetical protein